MNFRFFKKISLLVLFILLTIIALYIILKPKEPAEKIKIPVSVLSPEEYFIRSMSLDQKIAQLLIVGFFRSPGNTRVKSFLADYPVGGFILYKRNFDSLTELQHLTGQLKSWNRTNPLPLLISLDEEGGTVSRLPSECPRFPDARDIGRLNDPSFSYKIALMMGRELAHAGINLNYAPVFDVLSNPLNRFLFFRSFGKSPDLVAAHGIATIRGMRTSRVLAVAKHFPGHGDTDLDSHGKLPVIHTDKKTLSERELVPYRNAIAEGLDAVMVGHLSFPDIDTTGTPASLSEIFMKNILRGELGYEGIIITDEIEMQAFMSYHDSVEATAVRSILAGADMLMIGHTQSIQIRVMKALKRAVKEGTVSESLINEKVRRILAVKLKYCLSHQENPNPIRDPELQAFRSEYHSVMSRYFPSTLKKDSIYAD